MKDIKNIFMNNLVPMVIEQTPRGERAFDIYSRLLKEKFNSIDIMTTFQSRFGPQEWLTPYTDKTLEEIPKQGKKNILVICPGFASDCVETLEEIAIQGKESFVDAGGENFDLIPCLNDNEDHINLLKNLVDSYLVRNEYLLNFKIITFDSGYLLDGWTFISTEDFCISFRK